jgi:hypothetical protein
MAIYDSELAYIESCRTIKERIAALDKIIDALLLTATKAAVNENITEYSLNPGQTVIKTTYRGMEAIEKSITSFIRLRNIMAKSLNGTGVIRLVDSKNFR